MLEVEAVGKTIEKAIENALLELRAPREDVDIKVLDEGGLFKKAKVIVSISEDVKEKYEKKLNKKNEMKKAIAQEEDIDDIKEAIKKEVEKESVKTEMAEEIKEVAEVIESEIITEEKNKKEEKKTKERITDSNEEESLKFLKGLLYELELDCAIDVTEDESAKFFKITGNKSGNLVGYRGECLNAVQYLTSIIEQKNRNEFKKVVIDVDNYREKREQTLISLAHRMARKVVKTNHQVKLEPMTANERRIIHTTLQNDNFVTTVSKGTEPNRYLIIIPKKHVEE